MRYVLHIGVNKTGTSTLQGYLGKHREALLEHGICYPLLGSNPMAHHELAEAIKLQDFGKFALSPTAATNPVADLPYDTVLFSSENFHTIREVSSVANLFPPGETLVILYIREHVRYLASWYQQNVQAKNVIRSFDDFVSSHCCIMTDLIDRWREFYGENLVVRAYERASLEKNDIVHDFFKAAFKSFPPAKRTFKDRNLSISGNLFFLKLVLNHLLDASEQHRIVHELNTLSLIDQRFNGPLRVDAATAKRVAWRYREDRRILAERHKITFSPPLEGIAGNPAPDTERLRDDIGKLLLAAKTKSFALYDILQEKRDLLFPSL